MNLAPLRYAKVLAGSGGPIESIEHGSVTSETGPLHQANACLSKALKLQRPETEVFAGVDGTGSHASAMIARHMAISEAMERWAFLSLGGSDTAPAYGFDRDPTTTGMAAFPGLLKSSARNYALSEATERACIARWWRGHLNHRRIETGQAHRSVIEIENPLGSDSVIVTWSTQPDGWTAYGMAAAGTQGNAILKAIIEMERARVVLAHFHEHHPGFDERNLEGIKNYMERRILYYAMPNGHAAFRKRTRQTGTRSPQGGDRLVVDREIKGPWSRYATVWRALFDISSSEHVDPRVMTFYW
jgi:ribosomal protein S12 methylthiotransferase accessory factor YcaO